MACVTVVHQDVTGSNRFYRHSNSNVSAHSVVAYCKSIHTTNTLFAGAHTHLCDEELSEPLGQSAFLTGEDHLQHVTVQLLHHHKHFLWRLEHALQVHNAQVT